MALFEIKSLFSLHDIGSNITRIYDLINRYTEKLTESKVKEINNVTHQR